MNEKQLPDNVALNPHSLPYGSNLAAPVIKPTNLGPWKNGALHSANKYFKDRFDKIQAEALALSEEFKWNEIIFNAEMRFKPVVGKEYHLYLKTNGEYFMSLFAPNECTWGESCKGRFGLNYDNRWEVKELF